MLQGIVKLWFRDKGYGIITPSTEGPDVFFHATRLKDRNATASLFAGSVVRYEQETCDQGLRATTVELVIEFDWLKLPGECSHGVAVRNRLTCETAVFNDVRLASQWINRQRPVAS